MRVRVFDLWITICLAILFHSALVIGQMSCVKTEEKLYDADVNAILIQATQLLGNEYE
jgi:TM2 domain-containing membrane protein YozV